MVLAAASSWSIRAFASAIESSSAPTVVFMPSASDENSAVLEPGTRWSSSPAVMRSRLALAESTGSTTTRLSRRMSTMKMAPSNAANTAATKYMYSGRFRNVSRAGTTVTSWYSPVSPRRS